MLQAVYKQQRHMSAVTATVTTGAIMLRSSLKDALNSSVFICRLNAMYDSDVLTDASRAF